MPRFPGMSVFPAFSAQGTGEPVPVFVRLQPKDFVHATERPQPQPRPLSPPPQ
jgi:hypothetical protein